MNTASPSAAPERPSAVGTVVLGAICLTGTLLLGLNAWLGWPTTILLLILPLSMNQLKWRWWPFLVALVYFGSGNYELPPIMERFFANAAPVRSFAQAVLLTVIQAAPFLLYRADRPAGERALRMIGALLLLTLPPIGFVAWRNPLFVSGLLYSGMGFTGLIACASLYGVLAASGERSSRRLVMALGCPLVALALGCMFWREQHPLPIPYEWVGIDTKLPPPNLREPGKIREHVPGELLADMVIPMLTPDTEVIIFPESVFDPLTPADEVAFARADVAARKQGVVILAGASLPTGPDAWRNTVQAFGNQTGIVTDSRLPMPGGLWRLNGSGVQAHPFASDLITVQTRQGPVSVAVSLCFEDTVIWPHLGGLLAHRAKIMVSMVNAWATDGSRGDRAQAISAELLARLGGVPLVRAKNTWSNRTNDK